MSESGREGGEKNGKNASTSAESETACEQSSGRKPGLVYMSYIPPGLKPGRLRRMLSQYADVGRVYLVPEPDARRQRRKKAGGDRGKRYEEGWIEFKDKKEAKRVARGLNATKMGGPRRSRLHEDLWNLKYLPGFTWEHLVEEMSAKKRGKELRMQQEERQAKLERDAYQANAAKAQALENAKKRLEIQGKGVASDRSKPKGRRPPPAQAPVSQGESRSSTVSTSTLASLFPSAG